MLGSTLADNGCDGIPVQMIELHWVVNSQHDCSSDIFTKFWIQLPNLVLHIYQTEVSIWQAVAWNLGMGLIWDIFRISNFSEN